MKYIIMTNYISPGNDISKNSCGNVQIQSMGGPHGYLYSNGTHVPCRGVRLGNLTGLSLEKHDIPPLLMKSVAMSNVLIASRVLISCS